METSARVVKIHILLHEMDGNKILTCFIEFEEQQQKKSGENLHELFVLNEREYLSFFLLLFLFYCNFSNKKNIWGARGVDNGMKKG